MGQSIEQRIDAVRRSARRTLVAYALCWIVAVAAWAVLAVAAVDWLTRSQEPAVRWFLSLLIAAAVGLAVYRWLWPSLRRRHSRIAMARRIEARFPVLKERLSSAVAFAAEPERDPKAGSLELRRAAITDAESLAAGLNFHAALDRRPLHRARAMALVSVAAVVGIALVWPSAAGTAVRRLAAPWNEVHWPLRHQLAVVSAPRTLAAGDDFEIAVVDRAGQLPDQVDLLLRFENEARPDARHAMKPLDGRMVYRVDNVTEPFEYRVVGGDDGTMRWQRVDVVQPPRVTEFKITIAPPAYSGWPAESAERFVRALAGSELRATGRLDRPATRVALESEGKAEPIPAEIAPDGLGFRVPARQAGVWTADHSATYRLVVYGEQNVASAHEPPIELQVVNDSPPAVSWETPSDHSFVTPQAIVPIKALIKDDLAVKRVVFKYLRPDATDQNEVVVELHAAAAPTKGERDGQAKEGQSLTIDTHWDLSQVSGLEPGSVLAVHLEAEDFKPQTATTPVRRLSIVAPADFENRLFQQQSSIFTQIGEALRLERDAQQQLNALRFRIEETGRLEPRDVDQLQSGELLQRQVQRLLGDRVDGVEGRIAALLQQLKDNRIENRGMSRQWEELQAAIAEINRESMPQIAQELTAALKAARIEAGRASKDAKPTDIVAHLEPAAVLQQEAIDRLESLLGELEEWNNFSRLSREVGLIRREQRQLQADAESLRWKIAASPDETPTAEQRAAARDMAQRQQELARQFDKLQSRMEELLPRVESSDPTTARILTEATAISQRLAVGGLMRQAAREAGDYRVGTAEQSQRQVLEALDQVLEALSNRRDRELARTVESLRAAASRLEELRQKQNDLARLGERAAAEADEDEKRRQLQRLAKEQQELAREVEELGRQLERLRAQRAADSAAAAGDSVAEAAGAAQAGDANEAEQKNQEASRLLDEARQQLEQEIRQAEQDLVREKLVRLEQSLRAIALRQKNVVAEIERVEKSRSDDGQLSSAAQATVADLAAEQQLLAEETGQLGEQLADAAAFKLALDGVQRAMQRSWSLLRRGDTGHATQQAARSALTRLEQIQKALQDNASSQQADSPPGDGGPSQDNNSPGGGQRNVAELRLLAELQAEINRRTAEIETARAASKKLTAEQTDELAALADEQGRLAEMVFRIADEEKKAADPLADVPEPDKEKPEAKSKQPNDSKPPSLDEQLLKDLLE